MQDVLVSYFRTAGGAMRSRSVSDVVLAGTVDIAAPPVRLLADWDRETSILGLEPGDVEALSLARARARWPGYRLSVQAVSDWMASLGFPALLACCNVALMACRGARVHHDGEQYGGMAFCNLFVSDDKGLDVIFPVSGQRCALTRGTALVFDTCQPHAVVQRGSRRFIAADFAADRDTSQLFLTWEIPLATTGVGQALGITFDTDPSTALLVDDEQVRLNGARVGVCQESGQWRPVGACGAGVAC